MTAIAAPPRFSLPFTARAADIDELGHVNNAVWVRWIQDVALAHWHAAARPGDIAAYVWVILRHEIDYLRALEDGGTVTATTWVGDAARGARFDRHVAFAAPDGRVHVRARTTWAILDRATGRPLRVPADVIAPFLPPTAAPVRADALTQADRTTRPHPPHRR